MPTSPLLQEQGEGEREQIRITPTTRPMREPQALSPRLRVRRALTLLLLTLVVPGSAQLAAGNRRVGRIAVRVWLALIGAVLLLVVLGLLARGLLLDLVTQRWLLWLVALVSYVVGAAMAVLVVDAWRLGRPSLLPRAQRRWVSALAAVLVVVTFAVPVMVGRRVWAAGDLISSVFGHGNTSATATDGRYSVLLLGGDAGADRVGLRPDSVTLASIDAKTGKTVLFSLPRNLQNVPFPAGTPAAKALPHGWSCGDTCLLNAIYTWGTQNKKYFPGAADPGAEAMKQAVSAITGVGVDYYVIVDLVGFRRIIDAMGGININVRTRVPIGGETSRISGWIEPGEQHLDGYHALWYARSRAKSSDYDRMARQRCVMSAMVQQLDPKTLLSRFQDIASAGKSVVKTDLPASRLGDFIDLGLKAKSQRISSVQFVPPLIVPMHPDYAVIQAKVKATIAAAEAPAPTARATAAAKPKPAASATPTPTKGAPGVVSGPATSTDIKQVCAPG